MTDQVQPDSARTPLKGDRSEVLPPIDDKFVERERANDEPMIGVDDSTKQLVNAIDLTIVEKQDKDD